MGAGRALGITWMGAGMGGGGSTGDLDEPGEETLVAVDEGQPQRQVPVHVLHPSRLDAGSAQQHHNLRRRGKPVTGEAERTAGADKGPAPVWRG